MLVNSVRHDWPEKAGFQIVRPTGLPEYTFLHFTTPIQFRIDGQHHKVGPGACIFYAPNTPQCFASPQHDVIHNWMHTSDDLSAMLEFYAIPQNCLLFPKQTAFISGLFRRIEAEHFSQNPYKEQLIESYVNEFLIRLSRALQRDGATMVIPRQDQEKMQAIRREVLSSPERKWTVPDMAALAAFSPSYFHAVYRTLFGTSPIRDLIDAKMDFARFLLLSDERLPLPTVAEKLGYNDQYHFIRQFKSLNGITPGQYRKTMR